MTKREPLMTEAYFDEDITLVPGYIQKRLDNIALYQNQALAHFQILRYRISLVSAQYSRGYPIAQVREEFLQLLDTWETLRAIDSDNEFASVLKNDIGEYVEAIGLLAQAYLFRVGSDVVARLLNCIGGEGQDILFERLVEAGNLSVTRKTGRKLLYPKVYQTLYDAIEASAEQQGGLVQQFLKEWYKRIKNVGWHDAHKAPEGGGFFGYWCWEAAGVAYAFGIDDASFRDLPYYPKDLAEYARHHS